MIDRPYPGLRPFEREESFIFFGREEQTDQLLKKLGKTRFISVVGLSGCGKSSLVRAGMIAALECGYLASAGILWHIAIMRPGNHPLENLARALLQENALRAYLVPEGIQASDKELLPFLLASLRRGPLGLVEILRDAHLPQRANLLILVDQFEELFRYQSRENRDEIQAFVALLLSSAQQQDIPVYTVLTMRSDFIGECAQFHGLPEMINAGQFLIPRLAREQQQMAITGPAGVFGATVDPRLTNQLLNEIGHDPDQLPVLQHALMRMWFQAQSRLEQSGAPEQKDIAITRQDYEIIGKLGQALSNHADEAYAELDEQGQRIAEMVFRCLSERSPGLRDIRRPVKISEAAAVAEVSAEKIIEVVEVFRTPERCFLTPGQDVPLTPETVIDISHESLIRQWRRMNQWVTKEAESAETYRRLEKTACRWKQGKAALWGTPDLELALKWQAEERPTPEWASRHGEHFALSMEFLKASKNDQKKKRRKERMLRISSVIVSLLIVGILFFGYSWRKAINAENEAKNQARIARYAQKDAEVQARIARDAQKNAEVQARITRSTALAAQARTARFEHYPQRSLLLAIEALRATLQAGESRAPVAEEVLRETLVYTGGQVVKVFEKGVTDMALSPDDRWLATTSKDQAPRLWQLNVNESISEPIVLEGPQSPRADTATVMISPDSQWLAARSQNTLVWLWNLNEKEPAQTYKLLVGHDQEISVMAFSADSDWLLTGGQNGTLRFWDLQQPDPSSTSFQLDEHNAPLADIVMSADLQWIAATGTDGAAILWQWKNETSHDVPVLRQHFEQEISTVAISPDNRWLVTGGYDGLVHLWDLQADNLKQPFRELRGHQDTIKKIMISSDGHWLVTHDYKGNVRLWNFAEKDRFMANSLSPEIPIESVTISPDSHWLLTGDKNGTLAQWDLTVNDPIASPVAWHGHERGIAQIFISADSQWVFSRAQDNMLRRWDLNQSKQAVTPLVLQGSQEQVSSIAISLDSRWLATGSQDGSARLWDLTASSPANTDIVLSEHAGDVYSLIISPDSHWLISGSEDHIVRRWDLTAENPAAATQRLFEQEASVSMLAVSPDGHWIAIDDGKHRILAWDATASDPAADSTILLHSEAALYPIAISSDKRWLVTGKENGTCELWAIATDTTSYITALYDSNEQISFSQDNHWLVTGSDDGSIRVWDLTTQNPADSFLTLSGYEGSISSLALNRDGRWLVTGSDDTTVRLWDLSMKQPESFVLRGHEKPIKAVAISPDQHWVVTGDEDGTIRLWDLAVQHPAANSIVLRGHQAALTTIAISSDSRWLMSGDSNGEVRRWLLQLDELMKLACQTAGRNLSSDEWKMYFADDRYRETCSGALE